MKFNKTEVLLILLILSIVFHGIITKPKETVDPRFEFYYLGENKLGVYDKENEKFYFKSYNTNVYNELDLNFEENTIK